MVSVMARKDLRSVTANLAALAEGLPTQHVPRAVVEPARSTSPELKTKPPANALAPYDEEVIQFSLSMRKTLRKQLSRLADDADMTMRAFVLLALRDKGLTVTDEDLLDLRRERHRQGG